MNNWKENESLIRLFYRVHYYNDKDMPKWHELKPYVKRYLFRLYSFKAFAININRNRTISVFAKALKLEKICKFLNKI